jgi:hypothetical protein
MHGLRDFALASLLVSTAIACSGKSDSTTSASVAKVTHSAWYTSTFEAGNIGEVVRVSDAEWLLHLADDNDDALLRDSWRGWWYLEFNDLPTDRSLRFTLKNRGWSNYYVPVYSYDQRTWHHFSEAEVNQLADDTLQINAQFETSRVWMARFYPYTLGDLERYVEAIGENPLVTREVIGTTEEGRDIPMLTVTRGEIDEGQKRRVWIHARTHPGETGGSFIVEGLLDFLLSGEAEADDLLSRVVFNIVPIHNVDGVVRGNYRTTPGSRNLESLWQRDPENPFRLRPEAPREVAVLHKAITDRLGYPGAIPVAAALNLHSSNTAPDVRALFLPHFGPDFLGYGGEANRLWDSQLRVIRAVEMYYGPDRLEDEPMLGTSTFADADYPESWWWQNFGAEVMAITMETVYGRAGFAPQWVDRDNLRDLGRALGLALYQLSRDDLGR